jgi:predicted nucleic acid-binding Zn ribbon protein
MKLVTKEAYRCLGCGVIEEVMPVEACYICECSTAAFEIVEQAFPEMEEDTCPQCEGSGDLVGLFGSRRDISAAACHLKGWWVALGILLTYTRREQ